MLLRSDRQSLRHTSNIQSFYETKISKFLNKFFSEKWKFKFLDLLVKIWLLKKYVSEIIFCSRSKLDWLIFRSKARNIQNCTHNLRQIQILFKFSLFARKDFKKCSIKTAFLLIVKLSIFKIILLFFMFHFILSKDKKELYRLYFGPVSRSILFTLTEIST